MFTLPTALSQHSALDAHFAFSLIFAPSFVCKSCVHVFQLLSACEAIARHDMRTRNSAKQK